MKKIWYIALVLIIIIAAASPATSQNSVHIDQVGNNNYINIFQSGDGKTANIQMRGDYNDVQSLQTGAGTQSITTNSGTTTSSNNVLRFTQTDGGNHTANLDLTGSSGNNSVIFTQSGNANKSFNLSITGHSVSATVTQTNPTIPDTGSMSISCLTPPCSGYSYTRN